jgi:hypothetical protein
MAKGKTIQVQEGTGRFAVRNALPEQLDMFFKDTESELERLLKREVYDQLNELEAAWPKPPSKWVVRGSGENRRRKWLKRTGKSEAAFRVQKDKRGRDVIYTIQNDHVGRDGYSYVWVVHTYDFDMDGRKGRMTRAWHHFRDRATIQVQDKIVAEAGNVLMKELK